LYSRPGSIEFSLGHVIGPRCAYGPKSVLDQEEMGRTLDRGMRRIKIKFLPTLHKA